MADDDVIGDLLAAARAGDPLALTKLTPLVTERLRERLDAAAAERTVRPRDLVAALCDEIAGDEATADTRGLFAAVAARALRTLLADPEAKPVYVAAQSDLVGPDGVSAAALERVLATLSEADPRGAEMIELAVYGGLGFEEVAAVLGETTPKAEETIRFASDWLEQALRDG